MSCILCDLHVLVTVHNNIYRDEKSRISLFFYDMYFFFGIYVQTPTSQLALHMASDHPLIIYILALAKQLMKPS